MISRTLSEKMRVANVACKLQRLLLLDGIWTEFLDTAGTISKKEIPKVSSLAKEMMSLYRDLQAEIPGAIAQIENDELRVEANRVFDAEGVDAEARKTFLARFEQLVERPNIAKTAAKSLVKQCRLEIQALNKKVDVIKSGKHTPGDMRDDSLCVVGKVVFVLGISLRNPPLMSIGNSLIERFC